MQKSERVMAKWERGEKLDDHLLGELAQDFDQLLEAELAAIEKQASAGEGEAALGRLTKLNAFASAAALQKPSLVGVISAKAESFRQALEAVGVSLGAVEFSISFGIPVGISVTLTFKITQKGQGAAAAPE